MRKARFLWMIAILLLGVLTTVSCSTAPPTDAPPTDAPPTDAPLTDVPPTDVPPTDVPEPPKEPLVIEPGDVFVSGLWKDSYVAKNPCPDDVSGSVIEHQKLLYQRVKVVGDRKEGAYRLYRAGSLTEAAAMIDTAALSNAELLAELCESVSRVDFEQFCVVMVVGAYGDAITPQGLLLDQLVVSDEGFPTVIYQKKRDAAPAGEACITLYADFLLIRREAIPHLADNASMEIGHYICTRADVVLVPAEPVISDDWQDDTPAVNPCPEAVPGTPLRYEDIWFGGALQHNGDWSTDEIYAADNLTEAACLLRTYVRDYYDASFDVLCDRVCQIDFSRFRLLLFIEKSGTGSWPAFYDFTGLVHDGQGKLTRMNYLLEYGGGGTDDMAVFARFVLVRRADYDAPAERMQVDAYYYQAPLT